MPDAPGGTPPATPAHGPTLQEAQATISDHYGHGWLAGRDADRLAISECRAEVARLTTALATEATRYPKCVGWYRQMALRFAEDRHDLKQRVRKAEREIARLTQERDKWLHNFNASEQYQSGPTKRAEAAEARLAALTAALKELELEMRHELTCLLVDWPCATKAWANRLAALRTPEVT